MRLIDLDQTIFVPVVDESHGGATYEMQMTIAEFFDKFLDGFKPEVVDAIPVDWLEKQRNRVAHLPRHGKTMARVIDCLIAMWQKEQEVK